LTDGVVDTLKRYATRVGREVLAARMSPGPRDGVRRSGGKIIRKYPYKALFFCSALVTALVFWHQARWWVYVEDDPEPILKFELPWWIQVPASAVVGAVCGGSLVLLVRGVAHRKSHKT
jgi:hypothetical protein